jgi:Tol biopolymer transport system component
VFLVETAGVDLYLVPTEGGLTPRKLTSGGSSASICPAWSPSGGELAFGTYAYNSRRLAILPSTGGPPRILGDTLLSGYLTWAGGREVAYPVRNQVNIRLRDPETGEERLLLEQDQPSLRAPVASPDGTRMALWRSGQADTGLWAYSVQDGSAVNLTEPGGVWHPVGWSRDGNRIIARDSQEGGFYWIHLDGSEPTVIPGPELDGMDCVPHDREGGLVWVCSEEHSFSDVWIVEDFDLDRG